MNALFEGGQQGLSDVFRSVFVAAKQAFISNTIKLVKL